MRKEEGRKRENGEKQIIGLSADEGEEKKEEEEQNRGDSLSLIRKALASVSDHVQLCFVFALQPHRNVPISTPVSLARGALVAST